MNKTIFNLNYKVSLLIVSFFGILFSFLSNAFYVSGFIGFLLYIFRLTLFVGVFLILNIVEKSNMEFKNFLKRGLGYIVASSIFNLMFSVFVTTHLLSSIFLTLSGIVCFWLILCFVIEIIKIYGESKIVNKIFDINKKIGLAFANPIIKITSDL